MSNNFYKSIFKGTLLFGGVQVFQIFISLIRNKFSAVFLGPDGLGTLSLYSSSLNILITIAMLGFSFSAVRYISIENDVHNRNILAKKSHKFLILLGLLGLLFTLFSSYFLSKVTFKNNNHTLSYIILSLFVFVSIINIGNQSILQGLMQTKYIAKSNIYCSIIGLVLILPLLVFLKKNAIIPILILVPLISVIYTSKVIVTLLAETPKISWNEVKIFSLLLIKYGFVMSVSTLLGQFTIYIVNIIIAKYGSISDIGLYQAGISVTNQSIGLIFTSMSVDYFPKLTAVSNNKQKLNDYINQQGTVTILFSLPILCILIILTPLVITILLSDTYSTITTVIRILTLGMIFKVISFCLGYVSFAKGDKKVFFLYEAVWGNLQNLILSFIGYKYWGLTGLAFSFVIHYMLYLITVFLLCFIRYQYKPSREFILLSIFGITITILLFLSTYISDTMIIIPQIIIAIIVSFFSLLRLEKHIGIRNLIKSRFVRERT